MDKVVIPYTGDDFGETAYDGDAGFDLPILGSHQLIPGEYKDLPSGVKIAIPPGFYGRIIGRSSALRKRRIRVYEGIIDSGFRGELYSYVENVGRTTTVLDNSVRVAQLIVCPVVPTRWERGQLPDSDRGMNGFGSSDDRPKPIPSAVPLVYLGGPVDHSLDPHSWRDEATVSLASLGFQVFDPVQANRDELDPRRIVARNDAALDRCEYGIFMLTEPGAYGYGSPLEIDRMVQQGKRPVVIHPGTPGVYLRNHWLLGVIIVDTMTQALEQLAQLEREKSVTAIG